MTSHIIEKELTPSQQGKHQYHPTGKTVEKTTNDYGKTQKMETSASVIASGGGMDRITQLFPNHNPQTSSAELEEEEVDQNWT